MYQVANTVAGGCPGLDSSHHSLLSTLLLGELSLPFLFANLIQLLSSRLNGSSGILSGCLVTMVRKLQVMMTVNSTDCISDFIVRDTAHVASTAKDARKRRARVGHADPPDQELFETTCSFRMDQHVFFDKLILPFLARIWTISWIRAEPSTVIEKLPPYDFFISGIVFWNTER